MSISESKPVICCHIPKRVQDSYDLLLRELATFSESIASHDNIPKPLPVSFWLSPNIARELVLSDRIDQFRQWLESHGLIVHALDGDVYSYHARPQPRHGIYHPDWRHRDRFNYTCDLVAVLSRLLPEGSAGSITTIPIGWMDDMPGKELDYCMAVDQLLALVHYLARAELDSGRFIHVDFQPQCGFLLDNSKSIVDFFEAYLLGSPDELSVRAYLQIAYDVGHAAVLFEDPSQAISFLRSQGIHIGRFQCTSVVELLFDKIDKDQLERVSIVLKKIDDDWMPHWAAIQQASGELSLYPSISQAIADTVYERSGRYCRIYLGVPAHLNQLDMINTTRAYLIQSLSELQPGDDVTHYEIRTDSWELLDCLIEQRDVVKYISEDIAWMRNQLGIQVA